MILYSGPSQLDGEPIVAIATASSRNSKTGDMVQIWILRSELSPVDASRNGMDGSICGDCPQRWSLGGGCYVTIANAPQTVYRKLAAGGYAVPDPAVARALVEKPLRIGAYGDPAAVPLEVWRELLARGIGQWTGYTHGWRDPRFAGLRDFLMASCDTPRDFDDALAAGWRAFSAYAADAAPAGAVECLADARGLSCSECGICDGTRFASRSPSATSVWIRPHGGMVKRHALVVLNNF